MREVAEVGFVDDARKGLSHTHDFGSIDKCVKIECATSISALSLLSRYQREATKWGIMEQDSLPWLNSTSDGLLYLIQDASCSSGPEDATWPDLVQAFVPPAAQSLLRQLSSLDDGDARSRALRDLAHYMNWENQREVLEDLRQNRDSPPDNEQEKRGFLSDAFLLHVVERLRDEFDQMSLWAAGVLASRTHATTNPSLDVKEALEQLAVLTNGPALLTGIWDELQNAQPDFVRELLSPARRAEYVMQGHLNHLDERLEQMQEGLEPDGLEDFIHEILLRVSWLSSEKSEDDKRAQIIKWSQARKISINVETLITAVVEGADSKKFSTEATKALKSYELRRDRISLSDAALWARGLTAWLVLVTENSARNLKGEHLYLGLVSASEAFYPADQKEAWCNEYARALSADDARWFSRTLIRSQLNSANNSILLLYSGLPTAWFRQLFYENHQQKSKELRGREKFLATFENARDVYGEVLGLVRIQGKEDPEPLRWPKFVEAYLQELEKGNAHWKSQRFVEQALEELGELQTPLTARMWESRVAVEPVDVDRRKLREEAESDLGGAEHFSAGLWTTFIIGALQPEKPSDSSTLSDRLGEARKRGEELIEEAVQTLGDSKVGDDSDWWFSYREAYEVLRRYPGKTSRNAYNLLVLNYETRVREQQAQGADASVFTVEMLFVIAAAHAVEKNEEAFQRLRKIISDLIEKRGIVVDTTRLEYLEGVLYSDHIEPDKPQLSVENVLAALRGLLRLLSHDIRQPVQNLNNRSEWLKEDIDALVERLKDTLGEEDQELLVNIQGTSDGQRQLIQDLARPLALLDVAQRYSPDATQPSMAQIAEYVKDSLGKLNHGREIHITDTTNGAIPAVDSAASTLIINVLIHNAIRHGRGRIDVRIFSPQDTFDICVEVADEGDGLPQEAAEGIAELKPISTPFGSDGAGRGLMSALLTAHGLGGSIVAVELDDRLFPRLTFPLLQAQSVKSTGKVNGVFQKR